MENWSEKVAVVTGASSGIGAEICIDLVKAGMIVIGLARRTQLVEDLKEDLGENACNLYSYECDVTNDETVKSTFKWIEETFGCVSVLVNNAGLASKKLLLCDDESNDDIKAIVGTNLLGLMFCTREAYRLLKKYDIDGYIININSILGHSISPVPTAPPYNIYPGTKHAITATTEVIRQELNFLQNKKIRITSLSPGYVRTEMFKTAGIEHFVPPGTPLLESCDISRAVIFCLSQPAHVTVKEIIIKPTGEFV